MKIKHLHPEYLCEKERLKRLRDLRSACIIRIHTQRTAAGQSEKNDRRCIHKTIG